MGFQMGEHVYDCLTNLRCADDELLFSLLNWYSPMMMCDCKQSTESVGLKIRPDKTNSAQIKNIKIEILLA